MKILSLQVGRPQSRGRDDAPDPFDRTWFSGFGKDAVTGPVHLSPTGFEGDGQADLKNHGGPDKAVCVYPSEHFPFWRDALGLPFAAGAFGENLTVAGAMEDDACIGDVFQAGEVVVQVSQPRQPCWKLARWWRIKDFALRVEQTGRTGWYFRVLQPGPLAAGAEFRLVQCGHPGWTVARANRILHHDKTDLAAARALAALPALSESWRRTLTHRAETGAAAPTDARVHGTAGSPP